MGDLRKVQASRSHIGAKQNAISMLGKLPIRFRSCGLGHVAMQLVQLSVEQRSFLCSSQLHSLVSTNSANGIILTFAIILFHGIVLGIILVQIDEKIVWPVGQAEDSMQKLHLGTRADKDDALEIALGLVANLLMQIGTQCEQTLPGWHLAKLMNLFSLLAFL